MGVTKDGIPDGKEGDRIEEGSGGKGGIKLGGAGMGDIENWGGEIGEGNVCGKRLISAGVNSTISTLPADFDCGENMDSTGALTPSMP